MAKRTDIKKILVIGSGPIVIGQAAEFDYSGSQACKSLREEGYKVVLVNSNPATIQTDREIADVIYIEPLTPDVLEKIIEKEKPQGLVATMGGQTGLNLASELAEKGVLEKYSVEVLGTGIEAIKTAEDRKLFADAMREIGEPVPESHAIGSVEEARKAAQKLGYPVIIRPAFTLGGTGGGIANNEHELESIVFHGLKISRIHQVLIEKSLIGWYEFEYEVMRDRKDNCIIVCSMENLDPMGVHTGESIVVAPAQTLRDKEHQILRNAAIKIIRALKIEGGCNIQFAVNPEKWEYYVIEVNPRVSRSSALASKATGYPIAKIGAKIAIGLTLDEIPNDVTKETPASFEPALDYIVVKIPRWPFDKFKTADKTLGTQMKSTGEVMAIARSFEEALQKAIRSLDIGRAGICCDGRKTEEKEKILEALTKPTHKRLFCIYDALKTGMSVEEIHRLTNINPWFIEKIKNILKVESELVETASSGIKPGDKKSEEIIKTAKKFGFSDRQLAHAFNVKEKEMREIRKKIISPAYKMVDTCAGEFSAKTPYYYSTYDAQDEAAASGREKIIIIGSGPIRIGQGIEFDYCCVHGVISAKEEGYETIIINNNPETVSTDYDLADKLYFEPITTEDVLNVVEKEKPIGVIIQFGGQTPLNIANELAGAGVRILGTSPQSIDLAEDREMFAKILKKLNIPQADFGIAHSYEEASKVAERIGYPVLVRPSYVLGGRAMEIVYDKEELSEYIQEAVKVSPEHPILVDKFLSDAGEVDVDAISDGKDVFIAGIMEHIEHAGIHSGDSACILPPQTLDKGVVRKLKDYTVKLSRELRIIGLINIQYAVKDNIVYILEANPRASRTMPFVSKATGVAMVKVATKVILGKKLKELGYVGERIIRHVAVKEAVFPFLKLSGVDPVLGPEMKSTGEVMGIDFDFGLAFYKSQLAAGNALPAHGNIFISVKKSDHEKILPIAAKFKEEGFNIISTEGTARVFEKNGISTSPVKKVSEGKGNVIDLMIKGKVDLIINTPTAGKQQYSDGYYIRRQAVDLEIPYITTITAANAASKAIESVRNKRMTIRAMSKYYKEHAHALMLEDFIQ